ncbi:MAG: LacI family DNA-binding transcriptional regulator [Spirochaetales bacterium]|nr:LacI family DNA-binding transcriptional regulator [Spirochaetales bacterium]
MDNRKKVMTIKDIAELAKVSIGTVDRAIHNRGRVAKTTVLKIKKIIDEVGYKPNMFASRLSRAKQFTFAVLMPKKTQDNKYWESSVSGMEKAEKELSHYDVTVKYFFYDRYSASQLQTMCDKILHTQVDGILIAPVVYNPVKEFISRLSAHIPYILFNTNLPELSPLSFIGQDPYQSGLVCGRLMKMINHTPGTIVIMITLPNDLHIRERAQGFQTFFRNDTNFKIKEYELFNYQNKTNTFNSIKNIFDENKDLRGIYVTNVFTHYFAEYLEHHSKNKKIFLIGYDLIEKNRHYLNTGTIDFLISQKPESQGYEGIYALYRHSVLHESCQSKIMMPIDIIMKENLGYYIKSL